MTDSDRADGSGGTADAPQQEKVDHWRALAAQVGAEVPDKEAEPELAESGGCSDVSAATSAEDVSSVASPSSEPQVPCSPGRPPKARPRCTGAAPRSPRDWFALAQELGVEGVAPPNLEIEEDRGAPAGDAAGRAAREATASENRGAAESTDGRERPDGAHARRHRTVDRSRENRPASLWAAADASDDFMGGSHSPEEVCRSREFEETGGPSGAQEDRRESLVEDSVPDFTDEVSGIWLEDESLGEADLEPFEGDEAGEGRSAEQADRQTDTSEAPTRKRRKRGRRRRASAEASGDSFAADAAGGGLGAEASTNATDDDADDLDDSGEGAAAGVEDEVSDEAGDEESRRKRRSRGRRRRRTSRRDVREVGDERERDAGAQDDAVPPDRDTEDVHEEAYEDDDDEEDGDVGSDEAESLEADGEREGRAKHRKIPTWQEAISVIVSANMESRSKSGHARGGSGPSSKGAHPRRRG